MKPFSRFKEKTAAYIASLERLQGSINPVRQDEQTINTVFSATQTLSSDVANIVTPTTQPMCGLIEDNICSVSSNSTVLNATTSYLSTNSISAATQAISSFAQPMCGILEDNICQTSDNATIVTAACSTVAAIVPSFPVLACAGTACDAVGQCAVNSSSLFAPALALSAAALAGMAAAFAFRPSSNKPKRAPYPVSPAANAFGMQQDFNDGNFDDGLDNAEPEEHVLRRQLFPNSPVVPQAPASSPASAVNNNPRRRNRAAAELDGQDQEAAQPIVSRRRIAASPVAAQQPVQPPAARRRRNTEVARLSVNSNHDNNDDAKGSGFDLSTPNHPGGGVRRSYRRVSLAPNRGIGRQ